MKPKIDKKRQLKEEIYFLHSNREDRSRKHALNVLKKKYKQRINAFYPEMKQKSIDYNIGILNEWGY